MANQNLAALSSAGVSIWLDDLSRSALTEGRLKRAIADDSVVGVTTNPTIFAGALADGKSYDEQVREVAGAGGDVDEVIFRTTTRDVANACDLFTDIYRDTRGFDGRVSIEVSPRLAHDTDGTVSDAQRLFDEVDRENVLIKIPATKEGLRAITETIAKGISVNVTLIFSLERYRKVINAYLTGLERAQQAGLDLSKIHSVASFFVSRVDTEIDARLDEIGTEDAKALKGKAGIANARLAYQIFEESFASERAKELAAEGANVQRPLWASTGVKNPEYDDTMYVVDLVAPQTVNTMPQKTLDAVADHGKVRGDTISGTYDESNGVLDALDGVGVDYNDVVAKLEREAVEKFVASWDELEETVKQAIAEASKDERA